MQMIYIGHRSQAMPLRTGPGQGPNCNRDSDIIKTNKESNDLASTSTFLHTHPYTR